jgi:hypothetical protein
MLERRNAGILELMKQYQNPKFEGQIKSKWQSPNAKVPMKNQKFITKRGNLKNTNKENRKKNVKGQNPPVECA